MRHCISYPSVVILLHVVVALHLGMAEQRVSALKFAAADGIAVRRSFLIHFVTICTLYTLLHICTPLQLCKHSVSYGISLIRPLHLCNVLIF